MKASSSNYFWAVKVRKREAKIGCLGTVETLPRGKQGEKYRSKWLEISSTHYLGAQNSTPQIPLIISCKLHPNLVLSYAQT